ncbi:hypothetical protein ABEG17_02380 [Pedococcus sp. KACC 23699]|uniref:Uncharacterized protein n=1 Tax=Pedococcus sp. KACC 23699 TaxID=3149228 RepID=A0AAU7JUV2_9MICO
MSAHPSRNLADIVTDVLASQPKDPAQQAYRAMSSVQKAYVDRLATRRGLSTAEHLAALDRHRAERVADAQRADGPADIARRARR